MSATRNEAKDKSSKCTTAYCLESLNKTHTVKWAKKSMCISEAMNSCIDPTVDGCIEYSRYQPKEIGLCAPFKALPHFFAYCGAIGLGCVSVLNTTINALTCGVVAGVAGCCADAGTALCCCNKNNVVVEDKPVQQTMR